MLNQISLQTIGRLRTPFIEMAGTPIQPVFAKGALGQVVIDEEFAAALEDIEGFERLWLIYFMDRAAAFQPKVVPYRDTHEHGVLATRAPCRPNPIGLSVVRFLRREGAVLHVADVDMLDDTPLLDLKPYVAQFDAHSPSRAGWLDRRGTERTVADERFAGGVVLTLDGVCLETAAKKAHRELVQALLGDREPSASQQEQLMLLERLLCNTDFAALRTEHPALGCGHGLRVRLAVDGDGVGWEIL